MVARICNIENVGSIRINDNIIGKIEASLAIEITNDVPLVRLAICCRDSGIERRVRDGVGLGDNAGKRGDTVGGMKLEEPPSSLMP